MTTKNILKITILSILLVALTSFLISMLVTKKSLLDINFFNVKTETIFDEKRYS